MLVADYKRQVQEFRKRVLQQCEARPEQFEEELSRWKAALAPNNLAKAAASFKARTGIRAEGLDFQVIMQLPNEILED